MKPAIAFLNVFVGIAAILLAVGLSAPLWAIIFTSTAGFLAAAGAGAINCYIDRGLDRQMTRTRWRPIPAGRVPADQIFALGFVLSFAGLAIAGVCLNLLTAFFIGLGVFWYIFVYTMWLKPRTKWNIVIGGAAGCFSALAGWSAVTGGIGLVGVLIACLIFLWTPGHFWGLAIAKSKDYESGEVPMLPVVDGQARASICTAVSNVLLFPFTMVLYMLTVNWSNLYVAALAGIGIVILNVRFLLANLKLSKMSDTLSAWNVFKMSVSYLFLILLLTVVGHIL
jgi:protoheme IX farnesyltransferase